MHAAYAVMAGLCFAIAAAHFTIAAYIAPHFVIPPVGRFLTVVFFSACGITFLDLGLHAVTHSPRFLVEWHTFVISAAQVVVDWTFVIVAWRYLNRMARSARRVEDREWLTLVRLLTSEEGIDPQLVDELRAVIASYAYQKAKADGSSGHAPR